VGGNCCPAATQLFERTTYHDGMHAMSGRIEKAREICARLMQLNPAQRISRIKDRTPFPRAQDIEQIGAGYPDRGDAGMTAIGG